MGSMLSTLGDQLFDHEAKTDAQLISRIKVVLPRPAETSLGTKVSAIVVIMQGSSVKIMSESGLEGESLITHTWTPRTDMQDYEIYTETKRNVEIGEGIGVIYCEPSQTYIKLVYDEAKRNGVDLIECVDVASAGVTATKAEVAKSLGVGYELLYITTTASKCIREPAEVLKRRKRIVVECKPDRPEDDDNGDDRELREPAKKTLKITVTETLAPPQN